MGCAWGRGAGRPRCRRVQGQRRAAGTAARVPCAGGVWERGAVPGTGGVVAGEPPVLTGAGVS